MFDARPEKPSMRSRLMASFCVDLAGGIGRNLAILLCAWIAGKIWPGALLMARTILLFLADAVAK